MIDNREILEFHLMDIFGDYVKRMKSEYFDLPAMSDILSYLKSSLNDHSVLIVARGKRRHFNKISDLATHPMGLLAERKEKAGVLVRSLNKQLKDEDYLLMMALFTEDEKQSASYLKQALQKSPGTIHLQIASVFDRDASGDLTTLLHNLRAIPVKSLRPVKIRFFNIVELLELIECRPHDCNAANLTGLFEKVNLDRSMKYSIFYGLIPKLETETLYEVFCNLELFKKDMYSFGKLLEGALHYRMKRYKDAILALEAANIHSTPVSDEHKAEYQYFLEESHRRRYSATGRLTS